MSKHTATLHAFSTKLVSWANTQASQRIDRSALRAEAATLSDSEKMRVDADIVTYYAAKVGVSVHERSKPSSKGFGIIVADFTRVDGSIVDRAENAANTAITELRKIIFTDETATKAPQTAFAKMMGSVQFRAKKAAEKGEKLSAQERRDARALMSALASLIGEK